MFPPLFRRQARLIRAYYSHEWGNFINRETSERPCIILPDPPETLLLHDQCGGGEGWKALQYFKFTSDVASIVVQKLSGLPKNYTAIHMRASDTSLDFRRFLHLIRPGLNGLNILVCTDSVDAFQASVDILKESCVHQICPIPDTGGERLHDNPGHTDKMSNIHAISDLIGLANADKILYPLGPSIHQSGYTVLAHRLSCRKYLLNQLLGVRQSKS